MYTAVASIIVVSILVLYNTYDQSSSVEQTGWAYEITQINTMNSQGYEGIGVVIGIVDTGINIGHKDLNHVEIVAWKDYINDKETPYDDQGHGTHVAGIICADGEIIGGAPQVSLIVVKAMDNKGEGSEDDIADGIDFCVEKGADIICLSLGGLRFPILGTDVERACEDATSSGVFVVAAAGNDGEDSDQEDVISPANVEYVIAVGAIDRNKKIAPFSNKGDNEGLVPGYQGTDPILNEPYDPFERQDPNKKPELVAPGVNISSTWKSTYAKASGTSQAVPFVCSVLAILLDDRAFPEYRHDGVEGGSEETIEKFKNVFMSTSLKLGSQERPHDEYYGYGLIQAQKAYNGLE